MAGDPKTTAFMLGAATVMIGDPADVLTLTPEANSIGLVKNFTVSTEQQYAELTAGVKNDIVFSTPNQTTTRATMEVYEYTSKNLLYALGLDGTSVTTKTAYTIKDAITGDGSTTDGVTITSATDISSAFPVGSWVKLQASGAGAYDLVHLGKITAVNYTTTVLTLTFANHPIQVGTNFAAGDWVSGVNFIQAGSRDAQPYLGAKVVGILPSGNDPVTLIFPKMRITQGFNFSFKTDDFGNMPFQFTPYPVLAEDDLYSQFGNLGYAFLFKR